MKGRWLIPVVAVALLLAATGYWGYRQNQERQQLEVYLGNQYKESFYNLVDRVENMTVLLGKGTVSQGKENLVSLLANLYREAMSAQGELNRMPVSNATLMKTSKFLSQVGDYSLALTRENIRNDKITPAERDKLQSMRQQCANLSQALLDLEGDVNEGTIKFAELVRGARRTVEEADNNLLAENFKTLEEPNEPGPTLIYDGPFSDHIEQETPKGLTGRTITKEDARDIAQDFPDYAGNPDLVIKDLGTARGKIEAYQFSVQPNGDDKNHTTIDISKKGGHVVFYLNPRDVNDRKIDRSEASRKGETFLKEHGLTNMVSTYSWIENNVLTVSYAYKQDDVIIYPDLIKLKIAMDNGQVIGYEALGYLMSHRKRNLPKPKVKENEIHERLDDGEMEVQSIRLTLIPTPGLYEVLTWEARIQKEEETYLMYYDVETGEERNILRVIDTPDGTFTD